MPNRYDIALDGTEYRLIRGEGSYQQGASRSMVDFQEIETMAGSQFNSRNDVRSLFQSSWAGGSRWEKPVLGQQSIDSYYSASDLDMMIEPGSLIPRNVTTTSLSAPAVGWSKWVQVDGSVAYAVGEDGATYKKLIKYDSGTITTVTEHTNIPNADRVLDVCWDKATSTLYFAHTSGVTYATPGVGQGSVLSAGATWGTSLFMHAGELYYWNGTKLQIIDDPTGTPSTTTAYNDGLGKTWLYQTIDYTSVTNVYILPPAMRHAISTSEGVYLAKTVSQRGTLMSYIYRIDKDSSGTQIGTPVATLDSGYIILDLYWSLGSLIISATSDVGRLTDNDATGDAARVEFFHLTNGSLGSIGAPIGRHPDELVFKMLVSDHHCLYIGGGKNVWAYDPIRGGIHQIHNESGITDGAYHSAVLDSNGVNLFWGNKTTAKKTLIPLSDAAVNTQTGTLQSNYFDFSLPTEKKWLTEVTLMTLGLSSSSETWTVSVQADDSASWTQVAQFTSTSDVTATIATPVEGYRFRYKLDYATTGAIITPSRVNSIAFRGLSGEMVPFWRMMIDGTEARNVENEIVRPVDVFDNLKTLRNDKTPVTFKDNYESVGRDDTSTYTVRVHSVTIDKEEPKEARIQIVLVEV